MSAKEKITEEMQIHKEWYEQASKQTLETLPTFLNHIMNDYGHDYGTICHVLAAGSIATAWAMNAHKNGGITGFQSGAVMWEFIRQWNYTNNKCGLKIVDYDNFLYAQYEDSFQKTMSQSNFDAIKKEAINKIKEADEYYEEYLIKKAQYDIDIADFVKRYPDYYERQSYYDHLGMGTGTEWEAEEKKKASGFEFAPSEPYKGITKEHSQYQHWKRIVAGIIPFGYTISER